MGRGQASSLPPALASMVPPLVVRQPLQSAWPRHPHQAAPRLRQLTSSLHQAPGPGPAARTHNSRPRLYLWEAAAPSAPPRPSVGTAPPHHPLGHPAHFLVKGFRLHPWPAQPWPCGTGYACSFRYETSCPAGEAAPCARHGTRPAPHPAARHRTAASAGPHAVVGAWPAQASAVKWFFVASALATSRSRQQLQQRNRVQSSPT